MILAPIILFVYDRPSHTRLTIEALKQNKLAKESELFIYADGPKDHAASLGTGKVREYLKTVTGFRKVSIIEQRDNLGLAESITTGVSKVVSLYGKIIVLEDDIITSPQFLKYMNDALNYYAEKKAIWHISGWNYPISPEGLDDVFFWRAMNCWGWATWADRWQYYEKNTAKTLRDFSRDDIKRFNLDGHADFFKQVIKNKTNRINTWAIFWYVTIFKHEGLCVNPAQTFVANIGQDGSGTNCGANNPIVSELSHNGSLSFSDEIIENSTALDRIKQFSKDNKENIFARVLNKISRALLNKKFIK